MWLKTGRWRVTLWLVMAGAVHATDLPVATPESQGLDSTRLLKLLDYLQTTGFNADSVLLARHGKVVLQAYVAPYQPGIPHQINSATKSFVSTLAGLAIADGKLALDDTVAKVLPEYADLPTAQKVTLRQLLQMASGIDWNEWPAGSDSGLMFSSADPAKTFLQHPVLPEFIGRFNYSSGSSHLIGVMVMRATGRSLAQYAQARLFGPLGFGKTAWQTDNKGNNLGYRGLYVMPRDLLAFGELFRQNGQWQGKQIVPASWVAYATSPLLPVYPDTPKDQFYGAQWWVKQHRESYMAAGWGGQYVIVYPQDDITLVLTSRRNDYSSSVGAQFDPGPIQQYFLHSDAAVLPENPDALKLLQNRVSALAANTPTTATHSPLEKRIDGKAIDVANQTLDVQQYRLAFKDDEVVVTESPRSFRAPVLHYQAGLDGAWRTAAQVKGDVTIAAKARWLDNSTLEITSTPLEEYFISKAVLKFDGAHVKLDWPDWDYASEGTLRE